jgi:hypothetical protein
MITHVMFFLVTEYKPESQSLLVTGIYCKMIRSDRHPLFSPPIDIGVKVRNKIETIENFECLGSHV